ncbi:class I SAM-dependent methyltransferase [Ancylobacter terrae]|uniref:class I SAM-dependent methyltransferase n=1 Tax=Ancylobacter sp. sgz301288 TaxID=3342077 RepID=UPI00385CD58A
MSTVPFEPRRFRSTADFYARYRVPYPDDLIALVARRAGLTPGEGVLDLGCGPGVLALAFARLGARVTALDPEPEMLDAAAAAAEAAGLDITVQPGSSYELDALSGPFRLVVMGRSFHWMDRAATLRSLDRLVAPGGAVALFGDRRIAAAPDWHGALQTLGETYSPSRMAERKIRRGPGWMPHEGVLVRSPFAHVERIGRILERPLDADAIVGRAFSRSVTSPEALGTLRPAFEIALRAELKRLSPSGAFTEIVGVDAILGFRAPPD